MKTINLLVLCLTLVSAVFSQERITENVTVEWWVLPVFAVDSDGQPVLDLKKEDVDLKMNRREVESFYLYRQQYTKTGGSVTRENPFEKEKMVFLIFDLTLSTAQAIEHAKVIARQILDEAEKDQRFIILEIQPFTGLKYLAGPLRDADQVRAFVSNRIKGRSDSRVLDVEDFIATTSGDKQVKYSDDDIQDVFRPGVERFTRHKSMTFFQSFELLYYAINAIRDNKFIYLFTEGISKSARTSGKHMESAYRQYLIRMADYLGRSGAVLFIINPSGAIDADGSVTSGEDSLKFLARESGGRYLEGSDERIRSEIENIHSAYYEIAFPDIKELRGDTRQITLSSNRPGVTLHTLRSLEKGRQYAGMNLTEREMLVLNLLSGNSLFKIGLSVETVRIDEILQDNGQTRYTVVLPDRSADLHFDLYRVWVDNRSRDPEIETGTVQASGTRLNVYLNEKKGMTSYFVLINKDLNLALVRGLPSNETANGLEATPEPQTEAPVSPEPAQPGRIAYDEETAGVLRETARYCEQLQLSVFHFICTEKVVEIFDELSANYRTAPERDYGDVYVAREGMDQQARTRDRIVKQYLFDYQIIKQNGHITEQRLPLKGDENQQAVRNIESRIGSFFSKKIVLAPILLLSRDWQDKFRYKLTGREKVKGESMLVVTATPLHDPENEFLFGTIWIDPRDYSIRKIRVNPRSIRGYTQLEAIARKLRARLNLSAEIDFNDLKNGIRFPSEVTVIENYQGGPLVSRLRGKKGWDRSKTVYTYRDYRFFQVSTEVKTDSSGD